MPLKPSDSGLQCIDTQVVKEGLSSGTYYLWEHKEVGKVESSLLYLHDRSPQWVLCLPSSWGCHLACSFCSVPESSTLNRLSTNAFRTIAEHTLSEQMHGRPLQISFLGQGEPLLNRDNVFEFCSEVTHKWSDLRIGISTIGIAEGIRELAQQPWANRVKLQLSVHALPGEKRKRILSAETDYPIQEALAQSSRYSLMTKSKVFLNYVMLRGVNDSEQDANELIRVAQSGSYCVKISEYNPSAGSVYSPSTEEATQAFCTHLKKAGVEHYIFLSIGTDHGIGCGQSRLTGEYANRTTEV